MGVAAAGGVFHQPDIAGPENLCAPVTHANLHCASQVDDQASLGQRVKVHGPQRGKLVDPDLRALQQRAQLGVLRQLDFFHMNWLQVFRRVNAAHLPYSVRQERRTTVVQPENVLHVVAAHTTKCA
jgi:hypothetical protein